MRSIGSVLLAIAATLLLVAGIVFGLHDTSVMVPPPESVSEGFVRALVGTRYERALPYLSETLQPTVTADVLRRYSARLNGRLGDIIDVQGESGWEQGDSAEASVVLLSRSAGVRTLRFPLSRGDGGLWSIAALDTTSDAVR